MAFCTKCGRAVHDGACEVNAVADQPPPQPGTRPGCWSLLLDYIGHRHPCGEANVESMVTTDMRERDKIGWERYGVPLTSDNGRDHLIDAYQEALDMAVYLTAELDKRGQFPTYDKRGRTILPAPNEDPKRADDDLALRLLLEYHLGTIARMRRVIASRG